MNRAEFLNDLKMMGEHINDSLNNNAAYVGQFILERITNSDFTLVDVEKMLREINSRVHLVAVPKEKFGDKWDTFYPQKGSIVKGKPYALWICMNGIDEMESTLMTHNMSEMDNNIQLHNCGFLTLKEED